MKPLRLRLQDVAARTGTPQPVIEKDYALSYILAGVFSEPSLSSMLVLKGGTALKKLFFGSYRFSEDLDFSASSGLKGKALEDVLQDAVGATTRLFTPQGPFWVELTRYLERDPHPGEQDAFTVRIQFPWHPQPLCRVKLEVTHDEPVVLGPENRPLIHGYDEDLQAAIPCYRIEEIVAEKLRALLQTHQRLMKRGWNRPRARDYYDLWRVLGEFGPVLDPACLPGLLDRKCALRGVAYHSLEDFFTGPLVAEAHRNWDANLSTFVRGLPPCEVVLAELRVLLGTYFPSLG